MNQSLVKKMVRQVVISGGLGLFAGAVLATPKFAVYYEATHPVQTVISNDLGNTDRVQSVKPLHHVVRR